MKLTFGIICVTVTGLLLAACDDPEKRAEECRAAGITSTETLDLCRESERLKKQQITRFKIRGDSIKPEGAKGRNPMAK